MRPSERVNPDSAAVKWLCAVGREFSANPPDGQRAIRQKALRSLVDSGEVVFRKEVRKKFYFLGREEMTR